jgi:hypothetical protein
MNNPGKLEFKRNNNQISEESVDKFFLEDDVLKLSIGNIDDVYSCIYDSILKEAVYPHLTETSKKILKTKPLKQ